MMQSPFDHEPDEELGRLLREHLTGPAPEAFLRRMRLAAAGAERNDQWEVLAAWARPRVMAAAVAAGLLFWLGAWFAAGGSEAAEGVTVASLPAHAAVATQPPSADEIMWAMRSR